MRSNAYPAGLDSRMRSFVRHARLLPAVMVCVLAAADLRARETAPNDPDPGGAPTYALDSTVIAGGGITQAQSSCFELAGTIAQPVAGSSQAPSYSLYAGFWGDKTFSDTIFRSNFEACLP